MLGRWLTFGLSAEQEDRFRQANLGADLAQARTCILLILVPLVAFAVNDASFFGLTWRFHGLAALRLALLVYTILLLRRLRGFTSYRAYDRAEFAWGLSFAVFVLVIGATRPQAFVAHTIVAVVAVFLTVLVIPNRLVYQLAISMTYIAEETLVVAPGLWIGQPASVTAVLSMWVAGSLAIACAWQLHAWRRREFLAREEAQAAGAEAERQLAERQRAEETLRQNLERLAVTLQSFGDAAIGTDIEGRVTVMNRVAESLTGWTEIEAQGRALGEVFRIVNEDTEAAVEDPVRRVIEQGAVVGLANHTALIAKNGRRIAIADSAAPVRGGAGLLGVVLVFRDVSAQRQAEWERETTIELLRLVNASRGTRELIEAATTFFQQASGCEAVKVRLQGGPDAPGFEDAVLEGYGSVALLPLSFQGECRGLVQLCDRRGGLFSSDSIRRLERLAGHLAAAVAKSRAEEALRDLKRNWRSACRSGHRNWNRPWTRWRASGGGSTTCWTCCRLTSCSSRRTITRHLPKPADLEALEELLRNVRS